MIEPDESRVAISGIQVRPVARKDVCVEVDLHWWIEQSPARCHFKLRCCKRKIARRSGRSTLERFCRFGLWHFSAALLAGAPRIIVPKIEHRLTEVFDDVAAVEIDVFH